MRLRMRALLRRSIVATAFLSVLVGVAGALVLTGVIGARRAQTTYDDLLARNQPPEAVAVFCEASCDIEDGVDPTCYATPEDLAFLASLPGVTATSESTCLLGRLVREGRAPLRGTSAWAASRSGRFPKPSSSTPSSSRAARSTLAPTRW